MKNILFNLEMSKAIIERKKLQTRRIIENNFVDQDMFEIIKLFKEHKYEEAKNLYNFESKFKLNEIIWIREPAKVISNGQEGKIPSIEYLADGKLFYFDLEKKPTLNKYFVELPKWFVKKQGVPNGCIKEMARYFLKITNIRIEKLQNISDEDIINEGFNGNNNNLKEWWVNLWNKTSKKFYKYEDNPYVFIYDFQLLNEI